MVSDLYPLSVNHDSKSNSSRCKSTSFEVEVVLTFCKLIYGMMWHISTDDCWWILWTNLLLSYFHCRFFDINTSEKLICFWEYSIVNFIEGWTLFKNSKNSLKFSSISIYLSIYLSIYIWLLYVDGVQLPQGFTATTMRR